MTIWVDADACPNNIKQVICRAAQRTQTMTYFVANHSIQLSPSKYIKQVRVQAGFDVADNEIVERISQGDLLITSDIPLADEAISKQAIVMTMRGDPLTTENIKSRLNIRDFNETMRSSGFQSRGPKPHSDKDTQAFANGLDRYLAQNSC